MSTPAAKRHTALPERDVWRGMCRRCHAPSNTDYPRYGGRGISVCERWRGSFEAFFADMGPRPSPQHSIDRKDNRGNYEPGNCRWATKAEQDRNKSTNRMLEFRGERLCLKDWARRIGVDDRTLAERLERGWSLGDALTTPALRSGKGRRISLAGESRSIVEWARLAGMPRERLRGRLRLGWPLERALSTPSRPSPESPGRAG